MPRGESRKSGRSVSQLVTNKNENNIYHRTQEEEEDEDEDTLKAAARAHCLRNRTPKAGNYF